MPAKPVEFLVDIQSLRSITSSCSSLSWLTSLANCAMRSSSLHACGRAPRAGARQPARQSPASPRSAARAAPRSRPPSLSRNRVQFRRASPEQRARGGDQRGGVALRLAQHAGPAQQVQHIDPAAVPAAARPAARASQAREQSPHRPRARRRRRRAENAVCNRPCRADARGDASGGTPLPARGSSSGSRTADLEEAVVDGPQSPTTSVPRELPLAAREAGHAANHGVRGQFGA